jgi:IclR family acetate operon transcriptional repressor
LTAYLSNASLDAQTPDTLTDPDAIAREIEKVRQNDFSTDNGEFMAEMVAVAVPIRDDLGRLMSTLSVHAPTQRISLDELKGHLDRLRRAADDLSQMMLR